jgi:hypothetical protein
MGIDIGDGKIIEWIEFDPKEPCLEVDPLLEPTFPFWRGLEHHCMIECCGIDALSFSTEQLQWASQGMNVEKILEVLVYARTEIYKSELTVVCFGYINNLVDKSFFIQLLDHMMSVLKVIKE